MCSSTLSLLGNNKLHMHPNQGIFYQIGVSKVELRFLDLSLVILRVWRLTPPTVESIFHRAIGTTHTAARMRTVCTGSVDAFICNTELWVYAA